MLHGVSEPACVRGPPTLRRILEVMYRVSIYVARTTNAKPSNAEQAFCCDKHLRRAFVFHFAYGRCRMRPNEQIATNRRLPTLFSLPPCVLSHGFSARTGLSRSFVRHLPISRNVYCLLPYAITKQQPSFVSFWVGLNRWISVVPAAGGRSCRFLALHFLYQKHLRAKFGTEPYDPAVDCAGY